MKIGFGTASPLAAGRGSTETSPTFQRSAATVPFSRDLLRLLGDFCCSDKYNMGLFLAPKITPAIMTRGTSIAVFSTRAKLEVYNSPSPRVYREGLPLIRVTEKINKLFSRWYIYGGIYGGRPRNATAARINDRSAPAQLIESYEIGGEMPRRLSMQTDAEVRNLSRRILNFLPSLGAQ